MPAVLLNHDFVEGMAHRTDISAIALALADTQRSLGAEPMRVSPDLSAQETGQGPFIAWANRQGRGDDANVRILAELLLRLCQGPFVTALPVDAHAPPTSTDPPIPEEPAWRRDAILHLAHHALAHPEARAWVLSYDPTSDLTEPHYRASRGDRSVAVENLRSHKDAESRLGQLATKGLRGALAILDAAAKHAKRIVVLEKARDSARRWTLDCTEETLWSALIALDAYALALDEGLTRELAAERYYLQSSIRMSRESAEVERSPTCRTQREIVVPGHGRQYFDMHAKPSGGTRIHVWAHRDPTSGEHRVYVGHCGEHLRLPGRKP